MQAERLREVRLRVEVLAAVVVADRAEVLAVVVVVAGRAAAAVAAALGWEAWVAEAA